MDDYGRIRELISEARNSDSRERLASCLDEMLSLVEDMEKHPVVITEDPHLVLSRLPIPLTWLGTSADLGWEDLWRHVGTAKDKDRWTMAQKVGKVLLPFDGKLYRLTMGLTDTLVPVSKADADDIVLPAVWPKAVTSFSGSVPVWLGIWARTGGGSPRVTLRMQDGMVKVPGWGWRKKQLSSFPR